MPDIFGDIAKSVSQDLADPALLRGLADRISEATLSQDQLKAIMDLLDHAATASLPSIEITDPAKPADGTPPTDAWAAREAEVAAVGQAIDRQQSDAEALLKSADPADQARGQAMLGETQQVMEAVSTAIQQQGDMAKEAIQNAGDTAAPAAAPAATAPAAETGTSAWSALSTHVDAISTSIDGLQTQAEALMKSDLPADQAKGQELLQQSQQMIESLTNSLKEQSDAATQAIQTISEASPPAGDVAVVETAAPAIVEGQSDADVVQTTADHDASADRDRADPARANLEVSVTGQSASSSAAAQSSAATATAQAQAAEASASAAAAAAAATTTDDRDSHGVSRGQIEQHQPIVDATPAEATAQADHPAEEVVAEAVTPQPEPAAVEVAAPEPVAATVAPEAAPAAVEAAPAEHVEVAAPVEDHTAAAPAEDHSAGADATA